MILQHDYKPEVFSEDLEIIDVMLYSKWQYFKIGLYK